MTNNKNITRLIFFKVNNFLYNCVFNKTEHSTTLYLCTYGVQV